MYSVACCFLTHNHPDAMKDILDRCLDVYSSYDIDICIYDDSDDEKTKLLVEAYIFEGATNLYYIETPKEHSGDAKYLRVIQGYNLPNDYDYIWPCKDRVCFDERFIKRLRESIDEGHDAVIGSYEFARWDVGINLTRDIYTDPAELYRLYAVVSTNWECLVRKRSTMLSSIDWNRFSEKYNVGAPNNFNQTVSFFARLAEMDSFTVRICRYTDERYISPKASSGWGKVVFDIWIEKWVAANFVLPTIYDKYKLEAIKSQTNLTELFGSVEGMIDYHKTGAYSKEIYDKYRAMWSFITNIPIERLETIAFGDYEKAERDTIEDFEKTFLEHDFNKGWWLISANGFIIKHYDDKTARILVSCFNHYRLDMMANGDSFVFAGISSLDDLLKRYS